jgi:hypothetical protein
MFFGYEMPDAPIGWIVPMPQQPTDTSPMPGQPIWGADDSYPPNPK